MMAKSLHVITIALTLAACGLIFDSQRVSTDGSIRSRLDNLQTTSSCSGEKRINGNDDDATRIKEEHPSSSPPPPPPPLLNLTSRTEFFSATASISDTQSDYLTPLRSIDQDQYTIRILSWKRAEFLAASVAHHSQCPGVKQIQLVWSVLQEEDNAESDTDTDPYQEYRKDSNSNSSNCDSKKLPTKIKNNQIPPEVLANPKVVIEKRSTNRLTNRFDIQTLMETLGVLSLDDDILFPCDALDEGFFLWTQNPQHMITYHPRRHVVSPWTRSWRYTFCRLNRQYSLGLTKTAFLHRDYLFYYTHYLPDTIRDHIDNTINCEDIAMSMFVFNVSNGLFPLVPEEWTVKSSVHLHSKQRGGLSSAGISHQNARSYCVDMFAQELKVKQTFSGYATFTLFRNETAMTWNNTTTTSATSSSSRFIKWQAKKKKWYQLSPKEFRDVVITQPRDELMEFAANSRNLGDSIEIEQDPYIYIIPGVVLHNVAPQVVAGVAVLGILCLLFRYRFLWDRL